MNALKSVLERGYDAPSNFRPSTGGHMSYHRLLFDDANGDTYFTKAHDASFFEEEWREQEMVGFLQKEDRLYRHLIDREFLHVPQHISFQENILVLNGLMESSGWYWRAPNEENLLFQYIDDILSALIDLESIPSPKLLPTDEISVDTFYNFGWDKLHEIDIPKLVLSRVKKWGEKFQIGTIDAASYMANNYRDLVIKRAQIESKVLNHHDARQANIAWHPEKGTAIVDWSWADIGLPYGDTTMFLLDLHKSGHKIDSYMQYFNPTYAKMILGYWLHRSQTKHTEGNQAVRMQQFLSAIKASEIILNN